MTLQDALEELIPTLEAHYQLDLHAAEPSQAAPLEKVVTLFGDYALTLGYAALFAPRIEFRGNVPILFFGSSTQGLPADIVHVDLLHHHNAALRQNPSVIRAAGLALAHFWSLALAQADHLGKFVFDDSAGPNVVFRAG